MKKYFTLTLLAIFSFAAVSCDNRNDEVILQQDNDTYAVVLDINNVNFSYNATDGYFIERSFTKPLISTDVVLIYRKTGSTTDGSPVWQSIPRTLYVAEGELDYDFDFSKNDIMIYANGDYNISTTPQYLNNQTFRVVLVPASAGGKNANVDYSDYDSVIRYYNIDDSKIKTL